VCESLTEAHQQRQFSRGYALHDGPTEIRGEAAIVT
jgi:hypothetical protein